jgi:hypothetical protein
MPNQAIAIAAGTCRLAFAELFEVLVGPVREGLAVDTPIEEVNGGRTEPVGVAGIAAYNKSHISVSNAMLSSRDTYHAPNHSIKVFTKSVSRNIGRRRWKSITGCICNKPTAVCLYEQTLLAYAARKVSRKRCRRAAIEVISHAGDTCTADDLGTKLANVSNLAWYGGEHRSRD